MQRLLRAPALPGDLERRELAPGQLQLGGREDPLGGERAQGPLAALDGAAPAAPAV